jgi:hypothetical protein
LHSKLCPPLRKELAHVRVIKHEPKVRLEEVDAVGVLRVGRGRGRRVSSLGCGR